MVTYLEIPKSKVLLQVEESWFCWEGEKGSFVLLAGDEDGASVSLASPLRFQVRYGQWREPVSEKQKD